MIYQNRAFYLCNWEQRHVACNRGGKNEGELLLPSSTILGFDLKTSQRKFGLEFLLNLAIFADLGTSDEKTKKGNPCFCCFQKTLAGACYFIWEMCSKMSPGALWLQSVGNALHCCVFSLHHYSTLLTFKQSKVIGWQEHFQSGTLFQLPYNPSLSLCLSDPISISLKPQSHRHLPG